MDPSCKYLIMVFLQGGSLYPCRDWNKQKQLKGFKMVIKSVAWNKASLLSSSHSTSTWEFLVETQDGTIYEVVLNAEDEFLNFQEWYLQPVFTLLERQPVTGLKFDFYLPSNPSRTLVVASISTWIYRDATPIQCCYMHVVAYTDGPKRSWSFPAMSTTLSCIPVY